MHELSVPVKAAAVEPNFFHTIPIRRVCMKAAHIRSGIVFRGKANT